MGAGQLGGRRHHLLLRGRRRRRRLRLLFLLPPHGLGLAGGSLHQFLVAHRQPGLRRGLLHLRVRRCRRRRHALLRPLRHIARHLGAFPHRFLDHVAARLDGFLCRVRCLHRPRHHFPCGLLHRLCHLFPCFRRPLRRKEEEASTGSLKLARQALNRRRRPLRRNHILVHRRRLRNRPATRPHDGHLDGLDGAQHALPRPSHLLLQLLPGLRAGRLRGGRCRRGAPQHRLQLARRRLGSGAERGNLHDVRIGAVGPARKICRPEHVLHRQLSLLAHSHLVQLDQVGGHRLRGLVHLHRCAGQGCRPHCVLGRDAAGLPASSRLGIFGEAGLLALRCGHRCHNLRRHCAVGGHQGRVGPRRQLRLLAALPLSALAGHICSDRVIRSCPDLGTILRHLHGAHRHLCHRRLLAHLSCLLILRPPRCLRLLVSFRRHALYLLRCPLLLGVRLPAEWHVGQRLPGTGQRAAEGCSQSAGALLLCLLHDGLSLLLGVLYHLLGVVYRRCGSLLHAVSLLCGSLRRLLLRLICSLQCALCHLLSSLLESLRRLRCRLPSILPTLLEALHRL
mmetsp:Transcript_2354/g.6084  ORF Transcript_2354/g.6084 Transcript_2354/m.6084 type:complete len:564 (+) Transcript_2354:1214-2905(+)